MQDRYSSSSLAHKNPTTNYLTKKGIDFLGYLYYVPPDRVLNFHILSDRSIRDFVLVPPENLAPGLYLRNPLSQLVKHGQKKARG